MTKMTFYGDKPRVVAVIWFWVVAAVIWFYFLNCHYMITANYCDYFVSKQTSAVYKLGFSKENKIMVCLIYYVCINFHFWVFS